MSIFKTLCSLALAAACLSVAAQEQAPSTTPVDTAQQTDAQTEPRILRGDDRVIAASQPAPKLTGKPIGFNFEEAPIADVVRTILGDLLKVDYVLHPPINGVVTLATRAPVTPDKAVFMLETALSANGLALVRDVRGIYHVGSLDALKSISPGVRQAGAAPLPPGAGPIIVSLKYIGAGEMATILRPLLPAESLIRVDTVRNLLILAGSRSQAEGWLQFIDTFDVDLLKGMSVAVFPLKYASVAEIESALRTLSGMTTAPASGGQPAAAPAQARGASAATPTPAGATAALNDNNPLFGALRILPIERINSILVVTPRAAYLDEVRRWIERFDRPSDSGTEPRLYIYSVQNGNAHHLASVLQGIFGGLQQPAPVANSGVAPGLMTATGSTGGYPIGGTGMGLINGVRSQGASGFGAPTSGFGGAGGLGGGAPASLTRQQPGTVGGQTPVSATIGNVRVMSDDLNNSILIWGTRAEFEKIEATLKRLDLPPTQVLIEASIVEVTLNKDLQYGLQWAFSDSHGRFSGNGALSNNRSVAGGFGLPISGFTYTLKNPATSVRAVLSALSANTAVRVIASPSLMVLDNHTAAIGVGTQTPIQSGTTSNLEGTVTTTNIQYKDTGVNLLVTPSVNAGNLVTMQVEQSVTDVGAADDITKQRTFLQRQLSSKVAVRSGESIVMGGLIQERGNTGKSGVPILHELPVIGSLFGTTVEENARTELLVVITPRVVRTDIDIKQISDELRDSMKGLSNLLTPAETASPRAVPPTSPEAGEISHP